jgi:TrmH family RNA methyltransferase
LRHRRQRDKQQRILIDGAREIRRAVESGVDALELFVCPDLCSRSGTSEIAAQLTDRFQDVLHLTGSVFEKLSYGHRQEGLLAVVRTPEKTLENLGLEPSSEDPAGGELPLLGIVESAEKPGNLGAIVRTADAAGFTAVVSADGTTDLYNPNCIRASLGTVFSLPTCAASTEETLAWLHAQQIGILVARVDGSVPYTQVDMRGPVAIVLGSEAEGVSPTWCGEGVTAVRLPMLGQADSLNLSAAAAVLFYEARRQRDAAATMDATQPA